MHPLLHRNVLGAAVLLALVLAPQPAAARAKTPSERIASLTRAATDPGLADWQRAFYRERLDEALAGTAPARDEIAAPLAAAADQPVWSVIADTPRRQGHTLVYDDATGRLYAFGGENGAGVFNTVFTIDPDGTREWHALVTQGTPPPARMAHIAVLDAANRRMVVYGGTNQDGDYLADLWALSLDGTPTWTELTPAGAAPPARANQVATVDTLNGRMIVYGGANGGFTPLADLWSLSLGADPEWTQILPGGASTTGSTPASLLVDELRHRLVLVGTQTVSYSTNWTVWWLPLDAASPNWTSWVTPYTNSPSTYSASTFLFTLDQAGDRLVCAPTDYYSYEYSLPLSGSASQWTLTTATGAIPLNRSGRATAYDGGHRRMFVSGGGPGSYSSGRTVCDLVSLDLAGLAQWTPVAGEPAPRAGHSLAFDPARGKVHMFGGQVDSTGNGYGSTLSNDLWSLVSGSGSPAWSPEIATGGPLVPRSGASLAVDPVRDRLLLFGGSNGSATTNEVWQRPLSGGTAWTRLVIGGTLPHQRSDAAMVYDPDGDRLLLYGGYDSGAGTNGYLGDLWTLSLAGTPHWTKLTPGDGPTPREGATLTWNSRNGCAYLVGGDNGYYYGQGAIHPGQVWKLTLSSAPAWVWVSNGLPDSYYPNDEQNCAAYYDAALGLLVRATYRYDYNSNNSAPVISTLAPAADTSWTALPVGGTPPPQTADARGVFDPQARRLVWFGGFGSSYEGTWALSFSEVSVDVPPAVVDAAGPVRVAPNPARAACAVRFSLPRAGRVRLELLDLSGRHVVAPITADLPAGPGELALRDLRSLPAGVYFARLTGAIERRARVAIIH